MSHQDNIALNNYLGKFCSIVQLVFQKEKKAPDVGMEEKSYLSKQLSDNDTQYQNINMLKI